MKTSFFGSFSSLFGRAARLGFVVLGGAGALTLSFVGCTSPESEVCESGLVCPPGTQCAAEQDICIRGSCGNGVEDAGEACDDGNVRDGDNCSKDCQSTEDCGNGIQDPDEACDDGNTEGGDGCAANCFSDEACGNEQIDASKDEVCDDGNNEDGDGCSASCRSNETCGNGVRDRVVGEACDDGNRDNTDGCSNDCISTLDCGNGITDPENGEECDDGNDDVSDECIVHPDRLCKDAVCGDGFVWADREECDGDGDGAGGETETCNEDCTESVCGDGTRNATAGEACDDGGRNGLYNFCNATCTGTGESCGDGVKNGPEVCDPLDPVTGTKAGTDGVAVPCNETCSGYAPYCGDGTTTSPEVCDTGTLNGVYGTTCSAACNGAPPRCGDTVTQAANGEVCDRGGQNSWNWNADPAQSCTPACQRGLHCGDGSVTNSSERCDLGGGNSGAWDVHECLSDCSGYCGDGDRTGPEACDLGDETREHWNWDRSRCHSDCSGRCGDGTRQEEFELCDRGGQNGDWAQNQEDTCNESCNDRDDEFCGNGRCESPQETPDTCSDCD